MQKRLVWAVSILGLLTIFTLAWAPFIVRSYIEKHYEGVKVRGNVALHTDRIALTAVDIDRSGVKGRLDQVNVTWSKDVTVHGGKLEVTDTKQAKSQEASGGGSIQGDGLAVSVKRDGIEAELKDVRFDAKEVCFKTAETEYKGLKITATDGCLNRETKGVRVKHAETSFELPFDVPKLDKKQKLSVEGVTVVTQPELERKVTFEGASIDPFFKVTRLSTLRPLADTVEVELAGLVVNHPWVAPEPVTFKRVGFKVFRSLDFTGTLSIGDAHITVDPKEFHVQGSESCNTWIDAMPEPLPEALKQARGHFKGNLTFEVQRDPSPSLKIHNDCKFDCSADPMAAIVSALRKGGPSIAYMAYDKNDKLFPRTVGPRSKDWVELELLPPYVPKAFITMEDPGFLGHHGIIPQALENSFKDNLRLGKFFRGGSTISMQLAKNLWLRRHKTIGRKAQEALLTLALESCLSKAEILELYTNVVEFGPNLYGIGPAAKRYFDETAEKLEPDEAFYLASILPHPRNAIPPQSGGLARVRTLMQVLANRGFISDALIPVKSDEVDATGWETE